MVGSSDPKVAAAAAMAVARMASTDLGADEETAASAAAATIAASGGSGLWSALGEDEPEPPQGNPVVGQLLARRFVLSTAQERAQNSQL